MAESTDVDVLAQRATDDVVKATGKPPRAHQVRERAGEPAGQPQTRQTPPFPSAGSLLAASSLLLAMPKRTLGQSLPAHGHELRKGVTRVLRQQAS